ncbi:hypothetical protein SLNWT_6223 [Streptomyces albus]|uniref:Uncharacterized protein n=1 Tax=Streptomyces albus (strain ATCC 21838 / DSM 41398 / FERM P-419 / JCM 4703 / NBRC 107858) TaxID=1081613 RepID=A0A0B5EXN8_STRA4|nr:hypothetical protein SLNWT_6223 [Streptomyces albus]AOU80903.1 hypothetical protein SLNHY_6212 [Streptomyces albus]AYN36606.1 hypothetical protein DUI70_6112 [Streptomyces albus]
MASAVSRGDVENHSKHRGVPDHPCAGCERRMTGGAPSWVRGGDGGG